MRRRREPTQDELIHESMVGKFGPSIVRVFHHQTQTVSEDAMYAVEEDRLLDSVSPRIVVYINRDVFTPFYGLLLAGTVCRFGWLEPYDYRKLSHRPSSRVEPDHEAQNVHLSGTAQGVAVSDVSECPQDADGCDPVCVVG